jgi:hypothetical protein
LGPFDPSPGNGPAVSCGISSTFAADAVVLGVLDVVLETLADGVVDGVLEPVV